VPLARIIERSTRRASGWPWPVRYAGALGFVALAWGVRYALGPLLAEHGLPFMLFFPAILAAAAVFANGAGYLAALASALSATYYLPPEGRFWVHWGPPLVGLVAFFAAGCLVAATVETLHNALRRLRVAMAERETARAEREVAERDRGLLLDEFRHRSRNDLQSLVGLLLLRARQASPEGRTALKEAAAHALGLARVHTRLAQASAVGSAAVVDTGVFLRGLCADLAAGSAGDGLRPVALVVEAEAHALSTERAVQLGLVVNECVTNAMKYAFPDERAGTVRVEFNRHDGFYVLCIGDDGIGMRGTQGANGPPAGAGLGTRLLRALAAQLRGSFTREAGPQGGTLCTLRFPFPEPGGG